MSAGADRRRGWEGASALVSEWLGRESVRRSFLLGGEILLILVIAVLLEVLSKRENPRFDLTPTQKHSLSPLTQKVVQALDRDTRVTVFYLRGDRKRYDDLLGLMAQENPLFSYQLFDLDRTPSLAQEYGISSYGAAVVEREGERFIILRTDQEEILNALLHLGRPVETIYFVSGHGERNPGDRAERTSYGLLRMGLETENYQVRILSLYRTSRVPEDAALVVVSGPREEFLPDELAALTAYLSAGGKAIFMIDPYTVQGLCRYLARFGFVLGDGAVVDIQARLAGGDPLMPAIPNFIEEIFPRELWQPVLMPVVRPVEAQEGKARAFAFSSPDSWVQHSRERIERGDLRYLAEEDKRGPTPVAAVASVGGPEGKGGKVVVLGDSDFVTNFYSRIPGNVDFFMNLVGWLLEREELVATGRSVDVPGAGRQSLYLSQAQARMFFWTLVVLEPGLVFLVGTCVFFYRRRRG